MSKLIMTIDRQDYHSGLTGSFNCKGFAGFGEGWFNDSDIIEFCTDTQNLVETMNGTTELIGSRCQPDGSEYLETMALRCYVLSASKLNGIIGIHVTLAELRDSNCRKQEIFKMSGELQVRNHHLGEFAKDLKELVSGSLNKIILNGELNY